MMNNGATTGIILACLYSLIVPSTVVAQALPPRTEVAPFSITELPNATPRPMAFQRVYPELAFTNPVVLREVPDSSGRLLIAVQSDFVFITNESRNEHQLFLDLQNAYPGQVVTILGMEIHQLSGSVILSILREDSVSTTWELIAAPIDFPTAIQSLVSQVTNGSDNVGGSIEIGPDAQLYVALGDLTVSANAQDFTTIFGSILRYDIAVGDDGIVLTIPADNPYASTGPVPSTHPAIWAKGLREPALSHDPMMNLLYVVDRGENVVEEINRLQSGGNYGWPIMEGNRCNPAGSSCNSLGLTRPLLEYDRTQGGRINAALTSLGSGEPDLHGRIVYTDSFSGRAWAAVDRGVPTMQATLIAHDSSLALSGSGRDRSGTVFFMDEISGGIYTLRIATGTPNTFPTRLSDIPALAAAGRGIDQTHIGVYPYEPSAVLWSDGALKERFFVLPEGGQIGWQPKVGWDFPNGSVIIKNFILPLDDRDQIATAKRIETRLMVRFDDQWNGFSYQWEEDESDAYLLLRSNTRPFEIIEEDGNTLDYSWYFPTRTECFLCHTQAANFTLGLNTGQMNHEFTFPGSGLKENQLSAYNSISLFSEPLPAPAHELTRIPWQGDTTATLQERARGFMHANCSMCHQPDGGGSFGSDFRWGVPNDQMGVMWKRASGFDLDLEDPYLIAPGEPERSVLIGRIETLDSAYHMPPLATSRLAKADLELMKEWVRSLKSGTAWMTD